MIEFFCPGLPKPGGSKRAFINKYTGRASVVDACGQSKDWKADVKAFAAHAYEGPLLRGAIEVWVYFYMPRPKGHYGTGRNAAKLKPSAPKYPTTKPDASKLWRAAEDALTGIIWVDDAQVVSQTVKKRYSGWGNQAGVSIRIAEAE